MPDVRIPELPAMPPGMTVAADWLFAAWNPATDTTYRLAAADLPATGAAPALFFPAVANFFQLGQPAFENVEEAVVWMLRNWASGIGTIDLGSAPAVAIRATPNSNISAGQDIEFTVLAVPNSGATISSVVIKNGADVLHTFDLTKTPLKFLWQNVAKGNYTIRAEAVDSNSTKGRSTILAIIVGDAGIEPAPVFSAQYQATAQDYATKCSVAAPAGYVYPTGNGTGSTQTAADADARNKAIQAITCPIAPVIYNTLLDINNTVADGMSFVPQGSEKLEFNLRANSSGPIISPVFSQGGFLCYTDYNSEYAGDTYRFTDRSGGTHTGVFPSSDTPQAF